VHVDVGTLQAAFFAGLPGQIVLDMMHDGEAAEQGVAELVSAEPTSWCHDPAHAERCAKLLDVADPCWP